ncbi:MAG: cyclodeaminase/cyclohydrolase family protein [Olegusella sp.]|nr:cyclodeaminase/cyclohydrolase family protein [Olegusella sp.]
MGSYTEMSCKDFAEALAAKQPVPGGGGAAAVVGALAASLCSMVANYTVGKKKYADVEDDVKQLLEQVDQEREQLLQLIDDDAKAFEPLAAAYKIPKDDPDRDGIVENATRDAARAPQEMVFRICKVVAILEQLEQKGSRMLLSDVGCAAYLAVAALKSAALNVFVNTKPYRDSDALWALDAENAAFAALDTYVPRAEAVGDRVAGHFSDDL